MDITCVKSSPCSGVELSVFHGNLKAQSLTFSPCGRQMALGGCDGLVRFVDTSRGAVLGKCRAVIPGFWPPYPALAVMCVEFSKDGSQLLCGGEDGKVCLIQLAPLRHSYITQHAPHTTELGQLPVYAVHFSACGGRFFTGGDDCRVCCFDMLAMVKLWAFEANSFISHIVSSCAADYVVVGVKGDYLIENAVHIIQEVSEVGSLKIRSHCFQCDSHWPPCRPDGFSIAFSQFGQISLATRCVGEEIIEVRLLSVEKECIFHQNHPPSWQFQLDGYNMLDSAFSGEAQKLIFVMESRDCKGVRITVHEAKLGALLASFCVHCTLLSGEVGLVMSPRMNLIAVMTCGCWLLFAKPLWHIVRLLFLAKNKGDKNVCIMARLPGGVFRYMVETIAAFLAPW